MSGTGQALAKATVEEVNEMWAGLGYYRRARYLLDGAVYVQTKLGGKFPTTSKELQKIPGVLAQAWVFPSPQPRNGKHHVDQGQSKQQWSYCLTIHA